MNMYSQRGIAQVWLIVALAGAVLASGVVTIKKGFGLFHSSDTAEVKAQAAELVAANQRAQAAEAEAAKLRKAADDAQAAVQAAAASRHQELGADVAGAVYALEKEKEPSLNVQAALTLARSAKNLSDPVPQEKLTEVYALVDRLTAENQQIRKDAFTALAAKDAQLAAERDKEDALKKDAAAAAGERDAANLKAKALGEKLSAEVDAHGKTTAELKTVGQKLGSLVRWTLLTALLFFGACWVLPYIAKAHPGVAWIQKLAKFGGATFAWGLHSLHSAETKLAQGAAADAGKVLATLKQTPSAVNDIERVFDNTIRPEAWKLIAAGRAEAEKLLPTK